MLNRFLAVSAATLGLLSFATAAQAFSIHRSALTDDAFRTLLEAGTFTETYVVEGRSGRPGAADYEFSINKPIPSGGGGSPGTFAQGDRTRTSGETIDFEIRYDALTGQLTYTYGGKTLTASVAGGANQMYIRTRAGGQKNARTQAETLSSSTLLKNLELNDGKGFQAIGTLSSSALGSDSDVDYLVISGLKQSFTLRGQEVFTWDGLTPQGSRLAWQVKVGVAPEPPAETPEPTMLLGLALAGLLSVRAAHQR